jgi:hypothetical protein
MIALLITSSTNMIEHREQALAFDAGFSELQRIVRPYEKPGSAPPSSMAIRTIYVLFLFDPSPEEIPASRLNLRQNAVEVSVVVPHSFVPNTKANQLVSLLAGKLLQALKAVSEFLDRSRVTHDISELIDALAHHLGGPSEAARHKVETEQASTPSRVTSAEPGLGHSENEQRRHQVVVQFLTTDFSDLRRINAVEQKLSDSLTEIADLDGNDIGCGKYNIFIHTNHPQRTFSIIRRVLVVEDVLREAAVGVAELGKDEFTIMLSRENNGCFEL